MSKRLFCMLLALSFLLAACGSDIANTSSNAESSLSAVISTDSSIFTEDGSSECTANNSSDADQTNDPSEEPSEEEKNVTVRRGHQTSKGRN